MEFRLYTCLWVTLYSLADILPLQTCTAEPPSVTSQPCTVHCTVELLNMLYTLILQTDSTSVQTVVSLYHDGWMLLPHGQNCYQSVVLVCTAYLVVGMNPEMGKGFRFYIFMCYCCHSSSFILVAKPPKVTSQPVSQKDVLPGKTVAFSVQATGTQPLSYQWQWKPAGEGDGRDEWRNLSSGRSLQGVDTPTLTCSNVQSCNDGLYRCVIINCAEKTVSDYAELTVGKYKLRLKF